MQTLCQRVRARSSFAVHARILPLQAVELHLTHIHVREHPTRPPQQKTSHQHGAAVCRRLCLNSFHSAPLPLTFRLTTVSNPLLRLKVYLFIKKQEKKKLWKLWREKVREFHENGDPGANSGADARGVAPAGNECTDAPLRMLMWCGNATSVIVCVRACRVLANLS